MIPLTIPNLLSLFRIASSVFLLLVGYLGMEMFFYILFFLMLFSDALDGFIARMLNQTSELGARLDSYGDILTYLTTPVAIWFLWPEIINEQKSYIIVAIVVYILPAFFSLIKFKKLASYHTWITKISALFISLGIVLLITLQSDILFHIAVGFLVIEALENIAITLVLNRPKSDIRSLWHVWKNRL